MRRAEWLDSSPSTEVTRKVTLVSESSRHPGMRRRRTRLSVGGGALERQCARRQVRRGDETPAAELSEMVVEKESRHLGATAASIPGQAMGCAQPRMRFSSRGLASLSGGSTNQGFAATPDLDRLQEEPARGAAGPTSPVFGQHGDFHTAASHSTLPCLKECRSF